jgi:anti-sigma factor RsiW
VEVTRDVIIDLLPAYFSGEASEDTRRLVESYFERDPELARMARSMNDRLLQVAPVHLPENHQMKALRRTQVNLAWRVILLAAILAFVGMMVLIAMAFLAVR